jgi:hypothetical protein
MLDFGPPRASGWAPALFSEVTGKTAGFLLSDDSMDCVRTPHGTRHRTLVTWMTPKKFTSMVWR